MLIVVVTQNAARIRSRQDIHEICDQRYACLYQMTEPDLDEFYVNVRIIVDTRHSPSVYHIVCIAKIMKQSYCKPCVPYGSPLDHG